MGCPRNRALRYKSLNRDALFGQPLLEHQRRVTRRLHAQCRIRREHIRIGRTCPVPIPAAVHGHGSCRGVVQVVRVEFGDALRPAVVAEQCVVISQCHGGDATLPQRLCGPPGKRAQSGTSVDVVRVGRSGSQQHVAVAFEHQPRGAVLGLFQIGLRVQGLAHVEFDGGRIRRQRFHGGCWRAGHVDVVFRDHVARRVGDGDGEFAAEAGG